jgi:hypothetical protein
VTEQIKPKYSSKTIFFRSQNPMVKVFFDLTVAEVAQFLTVSELDCLG